MTNINSIGLDKAKSQALVTSLNTLLSSYQIQYMNARGFHWNIKGREFFELHLKFEEIYTLLLEKVDEIAERILTIEGNPLHAFSDYLETSKIHEAKGISNGTQALETLLDGYTTLISMQREILAQAGEAEDEGTAALMSDYIKEQEKLVWMLKAYLN
ncbi:DNA starvation/stationary phase protection protein [Pseudoalteromonas piscicida]|uniref:DNA starvation/stationary phase protection protein n=1 Tax=Pseudoalteromonas piscicida TaxID=43662 RepID=A0AAQ2ERX0_PSEO7|nr:MULTISPECIES: Dps family protein [Pseudoalteromonas]KJY88728.1 DNA polymerase sliding clamp subunit [Pseudoalteromonas piscicida]TMN33573.1 DNA starvation/stationary phase protection protein [Pseudoalteromonas piscicida]TMN33924.1 DNA starvation/stationary phase protection protein [Pseudoalteromonas piscicida]TMN46792.1 DNA starvation/stationary phase protection protein [Pseudoalteromonas piscicida]TMN48783.1 DNA starvation/stationary phase protection protein [Pseudoalteromonas piscicida]